MGCYTAKGLGGFLNNPDTNRKSATQALVEASAGAKMIDYALLRGKYDFIAVIEGTFEQMAAAMVAVSSGTVQNFTILKWWI